MRRIFTALAAAAMAAALLAPAASARLHVTFRYLGVHPQYVRVIDGPPRGESRGDVASFRYTLRVRRGVVGTAFFSFRNAPKSRVRGAVRLRFREGTVLARAAFDTNADRARFRVTAGTGAFRGSRGVLDLRGSGAADTIRLVLRLF